jgi:hypothetical protein
MDSELAAPRSRRALLAAAAAAGGALVASAALPLTAAAADPNDVVKETENLTALTTSITDSGADSTALAGNATGTGHGSGVLGTSVGGAGVLAWAVTSPDLSDQTFLDHTGVYAFAPAGNGIDTYGTGVWGDSEENGVYGTGTWGVVGFGSVGVEGDANGTPGSVGVWAYSPSTAGYALRVNGKVNFTRSGRVAMLSGRSSRAVTLAGTTATSKVFAVLSTSETGRYVRAVVPAAGKFTIYLNTTLTSSAVVSWFVLD